MEDLKEKTADLADHVEDLASTFYKLAILTVAQKATNIASSAIAMIVLCVVSFFVLLFAGIALSWWLGDLVESRPGGFLLGALFFVIIFFIVISLRKKIIFPIIRNNIISKAYDTAD
jgi:hypothetical protein